MKRKKGIYELYFKRLQDILLSLIILVVLSPLLILVALLVRIEMGSPVLFIQKRPGRNSVIFKLYKFRTMTNTTKGNNEMLPDSERVTKLGKFLRETSIDELPEIWNIIRGDMSFVGPRPLLIEYLDLYDDQQKRRHDARPGLSGLAQINGRNTLNWEGKLSLDVKYVDEISFMGDWEIMIKTIMKVLNKEGIDPETAVTNEHH